MKLISSNSRRNSTSSTTSSSSSSSSSVSILLSFLLLTFLPLTSAIKFELTAVTHPTTKCVWNYALADTLVVVTVNAIPTEGDGDVQTVDVEIVDGSKHNNIYLSKRGVTGETRMAINTHAHADLGVCFKNTLGKIPSGHPVMPTYVTTIDLDVDIGADAVDYNAIANQESLSGLETEMRKLEGVVGEIVNEMEYLKKREIKMKDTNDSTNARVQNFAWLTIIALIGLGIWQIIHLRGFFKRKYLID